MSNAPIATLTTGDIARLAGVDVSTVSNWRRRFDGSFPQPIVSADAGKRPTFNREEIVEWLAMNPRVGAVNSNVNMDLWRLLDTLRGALPTDALIDVFGAVTVLVEHHRRMNKSIASWPGSEIRRACLGNDLPDEVSNLVRIESLDALTDTDLERLLSLIEPTSDLLALLDSIIARNVNRLSEAGERTTPELLSSFLVALADENPAGKIYDPAAGYAGLLIAALQKKKGGSGVGVEVNQSAAITARRRLYLSNDAGRILVGDSLLTDPAYSTLADLVLVDPPLGLRLPTETGEHQYPVWEFGTPSNSNADMAWLQHAIAHLKPEGRAIVVTVINNLSRGGREALIRNELIRRGAVQAVITLPGKVRANTSIRLAVWVMGTPDKTDRRQSVLLIDAGANDLSALDPDGKVVQIFNEWIKDASVPLDPSIAVSVAVTELLAPDATLDPKRWLVNPADELSAAEWVDIAKLSYGQAVAALTAEQALPPVVFAPAEAAVRKVSLGDLQRKGDVSILRGRYVKGTSEESADTYPVLNVKHVRHETDPATIVTDRTAVSASTTAQLILPGDILIYPEGNSVKATVWTEPGWVLGSFLQCVRVKDSSVLLPEYVAAAISSPTNERFLTESTIRTNFDLKQFEISIPAFEVQQTLTALTGLLTVELSEVEAKADALRNAQAAVSNAITSGLVTAVLPRKAH